MLLSAKIYKNNIDAAKGQLTGYTSNSEREDNMKRLFMIHYNNAQTSSDHMPKVLLKAGHIHLIKGRNSLEVLSLGNFVSELATSNNMHSFHLAIYNNNASGDYGVLSSYEDYKPLADACDKKGSYVIDLRPLRKYVYGEAVSGSNPELNRVIYGFDAVLLIGGGSRGTYQLIGAE
jgi:hypothetical protein